MTIFDPAMLAGLKALSEIKAEDMTAEQALAVTNAIAAIDCTLGMMLETMQPEIVVEYGPYGETRSPKP